MQTKDTLIIAFSGGRTSAYMTYRLLFDYPDLYNYIVVFANTGKEREETLEFIKNCDDYFGFNTVWIEAITNPKHGKGVTFKKVDYYTASRNGEPFKASIAKHGISNVNAPMCTRELKTYCINAYVRSLKIKNAYRAIGIRVDEFDRMAADRKKKRYIYPLVSLFPTKKEEILYWWFLQIFDLELEEYQGNCDCCYKKSLAKLIRLAREEPELFEWWAEMEELYEDYIPPTRKNQKPGKVHFFRQNLSARDILALSQLSDEEIKKVLKEEDLHRAVNGCSESCEAFT